MAEKHYVCRADELPPGGRKIVQVGKRSIGVFNVHGNYHALLNVCPHQLAPLCEGAICGHNVPSDVGVYDFQHEGEIIRCPWHAWEFEIATGKSVFNPHKVRTRHYEVEVARGGESAGSTSDRSASTAVAEEDPSVESFPVEQSDAEIYVVA